MTHERPRALIRSTTLALALALALGLGGAASAHGGADSGNPTLWVANGADGTLGVIDRVTGTGLRVLPAGVNPHVLALSPDGRFVYAVNAGGHDADTVQGGADTLATNSLWAYDAGTGTVIARIAVGRGPTHPIPSPDGARVYVTNTDSDSVSVVDTSTWSVTDTITGVAEPHAGAVTDDGSLLLLATAGDDSLTVIDTSTLTVRVRYPVGPKARGLVATGSGLQATAYLTNKGDGTLSRVSLVDGTTTTSTVGMGAHGIRVSPDGATLYIALAGENAVAEVDAASGSLLRSYPVGAQPEQLDLSPDGAFLAVSNTGDNTVTLIDLPRQRVLRTVPTGKGNFGVQLLARPFDPDH